jgi:hypothetical protein
LWASSALSLASRALAAIALVASVPLSRLAIIFARAARHSLSSHRDFPPTLIGLGKSPFSDSAINGRPRKRRVVAAEEYGDRFDV